MTDQARSPRFKNQAGRMAERAEKIRGMLAEGMSHYEIAERLNADRSAISAQARNLGLAPNYQGGRYIGPRREAAE